MAAAAKAEIAKKVWDEASRKWIWIEDNGPRDVTVRRECAVSRDGQHQWGGITHNRRSGRGLFGGHWECLNPGCKYHNSAWLYDSIKYVCSHLAESPIAADSAAHVVVGHTSVSKHCQHPGHDPVCILPPLCSWTLPA